MAQTPILRIVLTGFMGAGKSTLGALLAAQLGWRFVDLDEELVRAAGLSVAELFDRYGEAEFRRREQEAIAALLDENRAVFALGGGALESAATRGCLLGSAGTHVIFLETPLEVALARCVRQKDGPRRPVLQTMTPEALNERYLRRAEHYREAHQTLATNHRTPEELADLLLADLGARLMRGTG